MSKNRNFNNSKFDVSTGIILTITGVKFQFHQVILTFFSESRPISPSIAGKNLKCFRLIKSSQYAQRVVFKDTAYFVRKAHAFCVDFIKTKSNPTVSLFVS